MSVGKVAFANLGCRVNRVEIDVIASELERAGCEFVGEQDADVIVVNSCAVTGEAEAKTRKAIRHAASLPQVPIVIATGCVATLFGGELEAIGANVRVVRSKAKVSGEVLRELGAPEGGVSDEGTVLDAPSPTGRTRPGIKIQDGCDNRCTYCIVWKARGRSRSVPVEDIVSSVREAVGRGAREVVLTGINIGRFRGEIEGAVRGLPALLEHLLGATDVERLRVTSIEPPDVTDELLRVMASHPERIAPFLHICLQSGSDATLARMGRVYDTAFYRDVVRRSREMVPGLALGTDVIVGFPGETDEEFEDSLAFCREMDFSKMHVFRYSQRPGTPAAEMEQVDARIKAERGRRMRALARTMRLAAARRLVGTEQLVLVQATGAGVTGGLFDVVVDRDIEPDTFARLTVSSAAADGTLFATMRQDDSVAI
ncbi:MULTISPECIES: MiaB/RimO family radical SAM methylthiotransferase [Atopobiaceae]|uniref:Threonylcarbamoyladenosine tRNA methylthiotransferase MtaB n=1 Tax=Parafannyhessea umbonata TaxID=604330 RepID=A0A1H6JRJ8_9ACTN|nr:MULTISPECIES: MiaB/RimO family radical SAM methylthiotransferase [Atopobiaceae]SEH61697.1 threonylcarbamoyladenosine tRNA methylthiotransferase MtaB [Parafannyhessea umbonata]SJZ79601.1 threonylcarbamoyladenosine tRNA methylthiotransferase MtaB [Olsenella sp. KH1P3]